MKDFYGHSSPADSRATGLLLSPSLSRKRVVRLTGHLNRP